MQRSKKLYWIFLILLVIYTCSIVTKVMQNDIFFYIPIGKYIAENHSIDGFDHWSFHENLKFKYPRMVNKANNVFDI